MAFKFQGVDFIEFDSLLSEDELLVRTNTRSFIEDKLIPIIEQCNRDGRFPRELVRPMGELGFYGATLEGYGCAGINNVEYGLLTQELERGDSGIRSFVSVQSALVMYPIYAFGSEEQKNFWLPKMATGEKLGCFGLTEPDFGSNPGGYADACSQRWRRLHSEWREDVDHFGQYRGCGGDLGEGGGVWGLAGELACAGFSGGDGPAGICLRMMCMASGRCGRRLRRGFRCRTCGCRRANLLPGVGWAEVSADVFEPGAVWD